MSVDEYSPICNSSQGAKEQFATAKIAEHVKQQARYDNDHQKWVDKHTENGTTAEIRTALGDQSPPQ